MIDSSGRATGEAAGPGKTGATPSSAESALILKVVTAMNMVRMNLGMYPPGHVRIAQSIDNAFDLTQQILRKRDELFIGFAGDTILFGQTAPERERENQAFNDYARCLNNLRIASFTVHRGISKKEITEFNRLLTVKPTDIWAMGKIDSVFAHSGVTNIKMNVIDADHFHLWEKQKILPADADKNGLNENFWEVFFARLKAEAVKRGRADGTPEEQAEIDPVEAVRSLNTQSERWSSAVLSYEKMVYDFFSERPIGRRFDPERLKTLTTVNALIGDFHPELKKQLIEVVERQFTLHQGATLDEEHLRCFPRDIFLEIIRKKNLAAAAISPTLVNLLKKMAGINDTDTPDSATEKEFSSEEMKTLFKREEYESYVPADYDMLLKKAVAASLGGGETDEAVFPLQEYVKTLANEYVDFRICRLILSLMEEEIAEEEYLACSRKLAMSLPEMFKAGRFGLLTDILRTLRSHAQAKHGDAVRREILSLLKSLTERESVAGAVTPFLRDNNGDPAELTAFLIASGDQNVPWLFDLYLDTKSASSASVTGILKGFGKSAIDEALGRLSADSGTIVGSLAFIRFAGDRSVVPSLKNVIHHREWSVRRELIMTLHAFDHPAVTSLLRKSLKAEDHKEVLDAVRLACGYRIGELLEDITSLLKTSVIRKKDVALYERIIGELAKSGDLSVIPCLERIEATRLTLSPKRLARLKTAVYRHLHHFPKDSVKKLLNKGSKSRSPEIRTLVAKILKGRE